MLNNWDKRAETLRAEDMAKQALKQHCEAEARAKEKAEWEPRYEKFADLARWVIRRYQASNFPPVPIYVTWREKVTVSQYYSRTEDRRIQIDQAYPMLATRHSEGEGEYSTRQFMVTSARRILYVSSHNTGYPRTWTHTPNGGSRHSPTAKLSNHEILVSDYQVSTRETASKSGLEKFVFLVENWQAMRQVIPVGYPAHETDAQFDKFCDEVLSFVYKYT